MLDPTVQVSTFQDFLHNILALRSLDFLGGLCILFIGWYGSKWAQATLRKQLKSSSKLDLTVGLMIANIGRYMILLVAVIAFLHQMGVATTSLITLLGATGLTIGLAFQGTFSHIAAGIMLIVHRPFKVGDAIQTQDVEYATVKEITLFTTEVITLDGKTTFLPNGLLWSKPIINYTANHRRRVDLEIMLDYHCDIEAVCAKIAQEVARFPKVLQDPELKVAEWELMEKGPKIIVRAWGKVEDYFFLRAALPNLIRTVVESTGYSFVPKDTGIVLKKGGGACG